MEEEKKLNKWQEEVQNYKKGDTVRACAKRLDVSPKYFSDRLATMRRAGIVLREDNRPPSFMDKLINKLR